MCTVLTALEAKGSMSKFSSSKHTNSSCGAFPEASQKRETSGAALLKYVAVLFFTHRALPPCQWQQVESLRQEVNDMGNTMDMVNFYHNIQCAVFCFCQCCTQRLKHRRLQQCSVRLSNNKVNFTFNQKLHWTKCIDPFNTFIFCETAVGFIIVFLV